ncbi:DUF2390 domain-containing protein [Aeromonas media]|uniref:DUF2390 domain-containing protein n=1 Tax=Aeromonas TaxID=642 RepID=UPI0015DC6C8B|nr:MULTISPECIES: DUF2390 domain-containing protein [Aeromonas]MBV7469882.1 DUF2390 domain-containing protein [Aeromonas sp. sif0611]UCP15622.1 DUF2390 domain-containing protein [Aeromonas media]WED82140.1 DUF2390 domain-containing protein [Aeromonas media]BBS85854.1 hypothetical protein WP7W18E02_07510 [Aeromonas media]
MRDERLMASERVAVHELPTPLGFWHWSGKVYGERSQDWLDVQSQGGNVNLALLLHHLDLLGIPVDLTDLQPALVQTEAVLLPWRTLRQQAKSRLAEEEYQAMLAHELELERLQQGVLLQTLRGLSLFRGKSHNLLNYLSLLGAQQGPLRDLIC